MNAILLAAGMGTRLRPLTDQVPKCLMKIGGKPLLEIWLEKLFEANIESVLINTHYLSSQVVDFVAKSKYCKYISIAHEPELLGTAATLIKNVSFFDGQDGLLIHADNYCTANIKEFIDEHGKRPKSCEISMMTFLTDEPKECGIVSVNSKKIVVEFEEKSDAPKGNLANGAVYILSPKAQYEIKKNSPFAVDFSAEILNKFINRIYSYENIGLHIDIGTINRYIRANQVSGNE